MTIAGSDSGAGAGLQADLKTFAALGVFGTSAVTAVTAQNTAEVLGVETVDPAMVDLQIEALVRDLPVAAVKTGMLAGAPTVAVVAGRARRGELPNLVIDPVLVSSTGRSLLDTDGVRAYVEQLLPHALVLTPNVREAAILAGWSLERVRGVDEMAEVGRTLLAYGPKAVLVKGGHLPAEGASDDILVGPATGQAQPMVLHARRVRSPNDHGTGCTLSAAIAAHLATGTSLPEAVRQAKAFVTNAIDGASDWHLGKGHGPLDHFGWGPRRAPGP